MSNVDTFSSQRIHATWKKKLKLGNEVEFAKPEKYIEWTILTLQQFVHQFGEANHCTFRSTLYPRCFRWELPICRDGNRLGFTMLTHTYPAPYLNQSVMYMAQVRCETRNFLFQNIIIRIILYIFYCMWKIDIWTHNSLLQFFAMSSTHYIT